MKNCKKPSIRFQGFKENWKEDTLGNLVDFYNGDRSSRYPNDKDIVSEGIPFINAGDIVDGRIKLATANKITEQKYNELSGAKIHKGDIIYCLRGTLGKNAYVDNFDVGTVASSLVVIRPQKIAGKYLFQVLNSNIEYQQRVLNDEGAAQPNLSARNLSKFSIPVISDAEQKQIADFFSYLDSLLTLRKKKLEKLQNFKRSCLEKMFPKVGCSVPELRFEGFEGEWEKRKLGEVFEEYSEKNHPNLSALTVIQGGGTVRRDESNRSLQYDMNSLNNYKMVREGDFIVHLRSFEGGLELSSNLGLISPAYHTLHGAGTDSRFYYAYFRSENFINVQLKPHVYGIRDGRSIDIEGMKNILIPCPTLAEQQKIGDFLENVNGLIMLEQVELEKLENLKKAYLEKMFV